MQLKYYLRVREFIHYYDVFFIDLWGVIHDGIETYDNAKETLKAIKAAGKKVIFISNAPRRAKRAAETLDRLNISSELYDGIVTSGEIVYRWLTDKKLHQQDRKFFIIGPIKDDDLLDGSNYQKVKHIKDADFVITTGFDHDDSDMPEKQPHLDQALSASLELICANPDLLVVRKSGKRALCAGVIAQQYEDMGGKVISFGKPYEHIYERAMQVAGQPDKTRVAAIGDSIITDIEGANNFGIDSFLVPGGILADELGISHGEIPPPTKLLNICKRHGSIPYYVLPSFVY